MTTTAAILLSQAVVNVWGDVYEETQRHARLALSPLRFTGLEPETVIDDAKVHLLPGANGDDFKVPARKFSEAREAVTYRIGRGEPKYVDGLRVGIAFLKQQYGELMLVARPELDCGFTLSRMAAERIGESLGFDTTIFGKHDESLYDLVGCADLVVTSDVTDLRRTPGVCPSQRTLLYMPQKGTCGWTRAKLPNPIPHGCEVVYGWPGVEQALQPIAA